MIWNLDPSHSSIEFSVRHMGISTVRGRFRDFEVDIDADDEGAPKRIEARIAAASIDTGEAGRDGHLRSADFFDAERHPELQFRSERIEDLGGGRYRIEGPMTIRGTTRPVSFEADVAPAVNDPFGNRRTAANARGVINRKDFGLTWNQVLEAGALLVSEEVRFDLAVQAITPRASAEAESARTGASA